MVWCPPIHRAHALSSLTASVLTTFVASARTLKPRALPAAGAGVFPPLLLRCARKALLLGNPSLPCVGTGM